jgi:AraC-like DNA-binding protein
MSQALAVSHAVFGRATLYRLDRPMIQHAHREGHLVFYLSDAAAKMAVDDKVVALDRSTVVAVSPWEAHSFLVKGSSPSAGCTCLVLYIKPVWFLENGHGQLGEYGLRFGRSDINCTPALYSLAMRLATALTNDIDEIDVESLFSRTTRLAYELSWESDRTRPGGVRPASRSSDFRVRRSLGLLNISVCEDVEMGSVARGVGLSRPHFFKLFKQQVGIPPTMYVNTLRSEWAIEALVSTHRTVADIATELGFSSQASFSRFFAANVGIPPSEYRRVAHLT